MAADGGAGKTNEGGDGKEPSASRSLQGSPWIAALFLVLALVVAADAIAADRAWPVAALLLIAVLIAVVPTATWDDLVKSVKKARFGPVSFDLQRKADRVAALAPDSDAGEGEERTLGKALNMFDLRTRLEWKLTYVAKHLLAPEPDNPDFLTIGSLKYDGYLTEDEARMAVGILNIRQEELEELPEGARKRFLVDAGKFVDSVRASIFWGLVKRRLKGKEGGDSLFKGAMPTAGARRDDLGGASTEGQVRVAPAFALASDSGILKSTLARLGREGAAARDGERQLIVVPDNSHVTERPAQGGAPRVVRLASLRGALEHP